jgi:uridine kinase
VHQVNRIIRNGELGNLMLQEEAHHSRRIAAIADRIAQMQPRLKVVLIGGPSSAGKTSTSKRLQIELRLLGMSPFAVSLDDFYRPRDEIPTNLKGEPDYECLEALDIPYLQETLLRLVAGETVQLPRLDFVTHEREEGESIRLGREGLLILEGIHSLNPGLTRYMTAATVFKVYISALTHLNFDTRNRVSTTDLRLLRRIERDRRVRGYHVEDTLYRWPEVRRGEQSYIFPNQEEADAMFNTALPYELNVLKGRLEPVLEGVEDPKVQPEARRLLHLLKGVETVPEEAFTPYLPPNSIFREFVGGSALTS